MTSFKTVLLAATTLTMLSGAAMAGDGNKAYVYQGTPGGSGSDNNSAEIIQTNGNRNEAGSAGENLLQYGSQHIIAVTQSGSDNDVGLTGRGVEQYGTRNTLGVTQTSNTNVVGQVVQIGDNVAADARANVLTINQAGGGGNSVLSVQQNKTVPTTGTANTIDVSQVGINDTVVNLSQEGAQNNIAITQARTSTSYGANKIQLVSQSGLRNAATINQTGYFNTVDSVTQSGGNDNTVTIKQFFATNRIGTVTQTGSSNKAAINQDLGSGNRVTSLSQIGNTNEASVTQIGFSNNVTSLSQLGDLNSAKLSFTGNDNGVGSLTGVANGLGLTQGTVLQDGNTNALTYTVTGKGNLFAFRQDGNNNEISGTVMGNGNQAAISQSGGNNFAFTQQMGSNNIVAISQ